MFNLPPDFKIDPSVLIFYSGAPHLNSGLAPFTWHPLRQASESPDRLGLELGFGNYIHHLYPTHRIAVIKHAHSGTNLYHDWNPGQNSTDSSDWGEQFSVFVHTVNLGMKKLNAAGYKPIIKAVLWQQGESDADKGGAIAMSYGTNLSHFIARVREQFHLPHLLFIYGYVYPPPNEGKGIGDVRKAEFEIDQNSGDSLAVQGAFVVPTEGLSLRANDPHTPYPNDHIHFGTKGILELGYRMAKAVKEHDSAAGRKENNSSFAGLLYKPDF